MAKLTDVALVLGIAAVAYVIWSAGKDLSSWAGGFIPKWPDMSIPNWTDDYNQSKNVAKKRLEEWNSASIVDYVQAKGFTGQDAWREL